MEEKSRQPLRVRLTRGEKISLSVQGVLVAVLILLGVLKAAGLSLIHGEYYLLLPMCLILMAVGTGLYALIRRIGRRWLRFVLALVAVAAALALTMFGVSFLSYLATATIPQKFATVTSPSGEHTLVVMRIVDLDVDHLDVRREERLRKDPESGEEYVSEDYGYKYTAWPRAAGIFYKNRADVEGEAVIGIASQATLMVEWPDADTAHFFVADPEPADGGEIDVRF